MKVIWSTFRDLKIRLLSPWVLKVIRFKWLSLTPLRCRSTLMTLSSITKLSIRLLTSSRTSSFASRLMALGMSLSFRSLKVVRAWKICSRKIALWKRLSKLLSVPKTQHGSFGTRWSGWNSLQSTSKPLARCGNLSPKRLARSWKRDSALVMTSMIYLPNWRSRLTTDYCQVS